MEICQKLILLLIIGCIFLPSIYSQETTPDETIRIETRLVSVPVIVSDRHGRYIAGLRAEDFTLWQNGIEQKIEYFGAAEEPLAVAILLDTSASARDVLDEIKDAGRSFIDLLKPADRAMVMTFDREIRVLSQLTHDHESLRRAITTARSQELGTVLREAVFQVVKEHFSKMRGRKAIILLTDGKDLSSRISPADLLYELQEADVLVYPIMFRTEDTHIITNVVSTPTEKIVTRYPANFPAIPVDGTKDRVETPSDKNNRIAEEFLSKISSQTAGRLFHGKPGTFRESFSKILDELRNQYRLEFYPPDTGVSEAVQGIKVAITKSGAVVRTREKYRPQKPQ
jgi:VWFA-related protein